MGLVIKVLLINYTVVLSNLSSHADSIRVNVLIQMKLVHAGLCQCCDIQ